MRYIKGFDGLRAISIIFVLLTHLGIYSVIKENKFLEKNYNLFSGSTGVMIFFTISGFLITSLLLKEKKSNGRINLKYFFIRRFLRLLPPLLIFFLAVFLLMFFNFLPSDYLALLISFFYLYNFVPYIHYTRELAHTWSLGVEEQFYFLWPFVINRIKTIKTGLLISAFIILCCIVLNFIYLLPIYFNGSAHFLTNYFFVDRWFIPACLPIMIGSFTSIILHEYEIHFHSKIHKNYLFLALSIFIFVAQLFIPGISIHYIKLFQPIGISCLLLWIYFNQSNFLVNLLELKPISFLGKISYGVYVFQGLFLRNGPGGRLAIQQYPLNVILVFLFAILSYYFVEKRIMKFKNKFKA
jgi:peptidoglycan/LPS O-acetylase OafA/YrhL